ncbi:replication initiator [Nocardia sp. NPDC051321]|uniref:replication initiator n=1 Tax=Nocardia sp. NPDC051321 TaxID=3364323 RepID=UPI00379794A3
MNVSTDLPKMGGTAAQRRALPNLYEVAQAAAEQYQVCKRPIAMRVEDPKTGTVTYEGSPCKSTIESVCPACAKSHWLLRFAQCREGWHVGTEPVDPASDPTDRQVELLTDRADLVAQYRTAVADAAEDLAAHLRAVVAGLDEDLRETGLRGRLPGLDATTKGRRRRSTRRRQDVPDLPRRKVTKTTVGKVFAGKHQPSMFVTLTMDSYGRINRDGAGVDEKGNPVSDGSPVNIDGYDYVRAARDIVFFSKLVDRWIQNLRRAVGRDVQYFATVEPQKRGAPHLHILIRGAISREILKLVTAATYHQVWWPYFNAENRVYGGDFQPVWDHKRATFIDPDTKQSLKYWDDALDTLDQIDDLEPAHVVRFGAQMDRKSIKGVIPEKAGRTIGYVTKYLTKSISEIVEAQSDRAAEHYDRLHAQLQTVPCSPRCAVWLEYGIVPQGASDKTVPGRCRGKAHRRDTLGLPGRRVLVSRRWSGKTLIDHKQDRVEFVRQLLADAGIEQADTSHLKVTPVEAGDKSRPLREHLILGAIAKRTTWRAQLMRAQLAADPPGAQETSATQQAA